MNKQSKIILLAFLTLGFATISCNEKSKATETTPQNEKVEKEMEQQKKILRHLVIFKFKDESNEADIQKLNNAFNALPESIPAIKDFEWGINKSPENFHQDFTHCYLLTFDSEEDRDSIYTPHPKHQAFVASLQPHLEKVFVVDYWTNP